MYQGLARLWTEVSSVTEKNQSFFIPCKNKWKSISVCIVVFVNIYMANPFKISELCMWVHCSSQNEFDISVLYIVLKES